MRSLILENCIVALKIDFFLMEYFFFHTFFTIFEIKQLQVVNTFR